MPVSESILQRQASLGRRVGGQAPAAEISIIAGPQDRAVARTAAMLASSFKRVDRVFPRGGATGDPAYRMAVILVASASRSPGTIWPEQQSIDDKRLLEGSKDVLLGRGFIGFLADGR
jgi:hypothetical protein